MEQSVTYVPGLKCYLCSRTFRISHEAGEGQCDTKHHQPLMNHTTLRHAQSLDLQPKGRCGSQGDTQSYKDQHVRIK